MSNRKGGFSGYLLGGERGRDADTVEGVPTRERLVDCRQLRARRVGFVPHLAGSMVVCHTGGSGERVKEYAVSQRAFRNGITLQTSGTTQPLNFLVVTRDVNGRQREHADVSLPLRVSSEDLPALMDALEMVWEYLLDDFSGDLESVTGEGAASGGE